MSYTGVLDLFASKKNEKTIISSCYYEGALKIARDSCFFYSDIITPGWAKDGSFLNMNGFGPNLRFIETDSSCYLIIFF